MKKITLLFILLCSFIIGKSQNQTDLAKFIILESKYNNSDLTSWSFENGNFLIFFLNKDNKLCFSNVTNDDQSYGEAHGLECESTEETDESYATDYCTFRWRYINSYDEKTGSALIELTKIHKPQVVTFELKMITEGMDVYTYKGYIKGTVDLESYL